MKEEIIQVRVPKKILRTLEALAKHQEVSLQFLMEKAILRYLKFWIKKP